MQEEKHLPLYPTTESWRHQYAIALAYSTNPLELIELAPLPNERHRWAAPRPDENDSDEEKKRIMEMSRKPKEFGAQYKITVVNLKGQVIHEHVGTVPVLRQVQIEMLGDHKGNLEDNARNDFLSAITWDSEHFNSVTVKIEKHIPLYFA
jgi:hypothetical protein